MSDDKLIIRIKYQNADVKRLEKIAIGDWIDLYAAIDMVIMEGERALIPLGFAAHLPEGYEANIVPRSSTFKNFGIIQTNHFAVIDESYCGDNDYWFYPVYAMRSTSICKGDKICQFRINKKMPKVEFEEVTILGNDDRGGHGSTGIR